MFSKSRLVSSNSSSSMLSLIFLYCIWYSMSIAILRLHYIWCIVFKFNFIVWLTSCMGRCQTYETKVILTNSLQNCCSSTCLHHFSHSPKKSWNVWKHRFPRVAISTSKPTNNLFWELSWTKKRQFLFCYAHRYIGFTMSKFVYCLQCGMWCVNLAMDTQHWRNLVGHSKLALMNGY